MTEADKRILECLEGGRSFLLDAAAGSGKTSSLIRALDHLRGERRASLIQEGQRVACITYTNVAKHEIIDRTESDVLFQVSTIHQFLWQQIQGFQKELKAALLTVNAGLPARSRRKQDQGALEAALLTVPRVTYEDRGANYLEGRLYHDDLIEVAHAMFGAHPMLAKLVAARFPFIFVDEYQDTHPSVIAILMRHIVKAASPPVIGFFGDKMQSIYPDVIGEMPPEYAQDLVTIQKEENYRCSKAVIRLLNRVRHDIQQVPAGDNVDGAAVYVNLSGLGEAVDVTTVAEKLAHERFGLNFTGEVKNLFLTHRLIARKAGYEALWTLYNDRGSFSRERFQSGEDPVAAFFLETVEPLLEAWRAGKMGRVIAIIGARNRSLAKPSEKKRVADALNTLTAVADQGASIGDILKAVRPLVELPDDLINALEPPPPPEDPESPEARFAEFLAALIKIPYLEVARYRAVFEEHLPYSTKHGVKGDEFENVIVVLDDEGANWNQYAFGKMLIGSDTSETRLKRTRNLFYVCCSRARVNLVVADLSSGRDAQAAATELFGRDSVTSSVSSLQ
jgi:DNA helicase-2/ATP-dependent DNA helicase PcrA